MNISVRYYTRSGNTRKLADSIAETLGCLAESISVPLEEKADILFLGCSYYAFDIDPSVKSFIERNKERIGKIVCFGTSAGMGSTMKCVKKVAEPLGIEVAEDAFHCYGSFGPFHKNRPNPEDLADARRFAKRVVQK